MNMNNKRTRQQIKKLASLFRVLGQTARLRILLAIGESEACVCHLEVILGYRQAYISQHMMELRKLGFVDARRDGRFIFYRLSDHRTLDLINMAADLTGLAQKDLSALSPSQPLPGCCCPNCVAEIQPISIFEEETKS